MKILNSNLCSLWFFFGFCNIFEGIQEVNSHSNWFTFKCFIYYANVIFYKPKLLNVSHKREHVLIYILCIMLCLYLVALNYILLTINFFSENNICKNIFILPKVNTARLNEKAICNYLNNNNFLNLQEYIYIFELLL